MTPVLGQTATDVKPWARVAILLVSLTAACALSVRLTGSIVPTRTGDVLVFQNALLLVVLGSTILEYKFTAPADAVVNSLAGIVTLVSVYADSPTTGWWCVFDYCAAVFILATVCTAVSSGPMLSGWQRLIAKITYPPAVVFGKARVLFSVVFLFGVFTFYGVQSKATAELVVFWGAYIAIWPIGLPELISRLRRGTWDVSPIGRVVRTDSPNLVRVSLSPSTSWEASRIKVYQRADGMQEHIIPLYSQPQEDQLVGTGLCFPASGPRVPNLLVGHVYDADGAFDEQAIAAALGGGPGSQLIGFVVEDSAISEIRFEASNPNLCNEGMLVSCSVGTARVFYQITNGVTREESLETDRHGYQVATAAQLGLLDRARGFVKYSWLPRMNTPVFAEPASFGAETQTPTLGDFKYGQLPGTQLAIEGPFGDAMEHHTAILGVTGSGKTELAFDLIRHAVDQGIKVVCIDLTAKYRGRLVDLTPHGLSISPALSAELGTKLFDVETGQYGAGNEKKALKSFSDGLRNEVNGSLEAFLRSTAPEHRVGIVTLEEISNTKATLYITELFMTCLLHFAKNYAAECPRVLIVVEEAHTVMPEPTTMGLGDYDSRGLVSKITQIALQGRKYGVGLLVIAQRTATVSKSVLTQCNTIITLSCFDDTSLTFVKNFYGDTHSKLIPNLARLQAVMFGKGIRSERPIVVEIPFDPAKVAAERRVTAVDTRGPSDASGRTPTV